MTHSAPRREITLVFDVAGVLLEWDSSVVYDELLAGTGTSTREFLSTVIDSEAQNAMGAGRPMAEVLDECIQKHPRWEKEIRAWLERWDEMLIGEIGGTVSVIAELKERGYRVFLLGNWAREEFERARERFPFLDSVDDVLLSGDCGVLKPDPGIFELAESRFGLEAEKTIFVDDRKDNVMAAIGRNWNGIVFEDPRQLYLVLMDYGIL